MIPISTILVCSDSLRLQEEFYAYKSSTWVDFLPFRSRFSGMRAIFIDCVCLKTVLWALRYLDECKLCFRALTDELGVKIKDDEQVL